MSGLFSVLISLLVFNILVLVHEYGHFIVAVKNGILVEEFAIGMGPTVIKKRKGDTIYSLRLLPLGGFCRMLGEDEEDYDPRSFNSKTTFQRMAVVVMGPVMNFVFAFFIVFVVAATANAVVYPKVVNVIDGTDAQAQGLTSGDEIIAINGEKIGTFQDMYLVLDGCNGNDLQITVLRDGKEEKLTVKPSVSEDNRWIIGFTPTVKTGLFAKSVYGYERTNLIETVETSVYTMRYYIKSVVVGFVRLFTLNITPQEVAGPIGIVQIMGDTVEEGLTYSVGSAVRSLMTIAALLSTNLGAINLFPIPAMDGGRLVFLIIETIRGKAIDKNKEGFIHFVGFVLLMVFMVLIASNDIVRIFK